MTASPPPVPTTTRTDSGDHATIRYGKFSGSWRWSGLSRGLVIPVVMSLPALFIALRAPSKGDVDAKVKQVETAVEATAETKAEEVRQATAAPIDNHADELATLRAQVATLAGAIELYSKLPPAPAPPVAGQSKGRRRREIAKQVKAAVTDLKAIQVRAATEPAPLTAPKAPPPEAPKDGAAQQKPRDGGGANP